MTDFGSVISLCTRAITAAIDWLGDIHVALPGVATAMLASFVIYSLVRLLLVPFVGSGASDLATRPIQNARMQRNKSRGKGG